MEVRVYPLVLTAMVCLDAVVRAQDPAPSAPAASAPDATAAPPPGTAVAAVGCPPSGTIIIAPPPGYYGWIPGPFGPVPYIPPTIVIAPGGGFVPRPLPVVVGPPPGTPPVIGLGGFPTNNPAVDAANLRVQQGVLAEMQRRQAARVERVARRPIPERAAMLLTVGDRLFRAGELNRAAERYQQALVADSSDADPHLRLAQVALVRGQYTEAVQKLREAEAVQPGWLLEHPFDIQTLFPEPREFAAMIETLEDHLRRNPNDRDATLLLGAQLFLSGRTENAAEVLRRLTDRKPDPTLRAYLEASRALE